MDLRSCRANYRALAPTLTERSRRVWAATEARPLSRGGMALVARATGISASTDRPRAQRIAVARAGAAGPGAAAGWGRKQTIDKDPTLLRDLEGLVQPTTSGAPDSPPAARPRRCTRTLARTLHSLGHRVSHQLVRELLSPAGYSLQANRKRAKDHRIPTGTPSSATSPRRSTSSRPRASR